MIASAQADGDDWRSAVRQVHEKWQAALDEERDITAQAKILEDKLKVQEEHAALLKTRLDTLNQRVGASSPRLFQPEAIPPMGDSTNKREKELVAASADRVVIIAGKDGPLGAGFLCLQGAETRVYTSAPLVSGNREISITALDGTKLPVSKDLSCPEGIDLVCFHPTIPMPSHFDWAATAELPNVGDRVVVIVANPKTRKLTGISGAIRGIGPDTWELDAVLLPEMSGAPVLSLESGKVIGIVTPQVDGASEEWAIGTRHQASRSFAARLDRVGKWQSMDLDRFANEAAYVEQINDKTRLAWAAHLLIDFELGGRRDEPPGPEAIFFPENREKNQEEIRKKQERQEQVLRFAGLHASNLHIQRAKSWLADYRATYQVSAGSDLDGRLASLYRYLRTDLEQKERDLSAQLTWYHAKQYQSALEWRREAARIMTVNGDRMGR